MGLLWRLSTSSSADRERGDGTVYTWKDYGGKVFETIHRSFYDYTILAKIFQTNYSFCVK